MAAVVQPQPKIFRISNSQYQYGDCLDRIEFYTDVIHVREHVDRGDAGDGGRTGPLLSKQLLCKDGAVASF